jgi:hypothetical protein
MTGNTRNLKTMEYSEDILESCCVFGRSWVLVPPKVILMTYNFRFFLSFFLWNIRSARALTVSLLRFLHHTQLDTPSHTSVPTHTDSVRFLWTNDQLVAEAAICTKHKHKRQTAMPSAGFETTTSEIERQRTSALDGTTIEIGDFLSISGQIAV